MTNQKWQLWNGEEDEPILVAEFDTKNDAIRHAKWLESLDGKSISFHYNASFNIWSGDYSGTGYTVSNHGFPQ